MTFFDVFRLSGIWKSVEKPFARLVEEGVGEEGGGVGGGGVLSLVLDCLFNLSHVYLRLSSFLQRKRVLASPAFSSSSLSPSSFSSSLFSSWLCSGLCSISHTTSSPDFYSFYAHTTTPDVLDIRGYPEMVLGSEIISKIPACHLTSTSACLVSPLEAYHSLKEKDEEAKEGEEKKEEKKEEKDQEKMLSDHLRRGCDTLLATLYNYIYTFLEKKQLEGGGQTVEKREVLGEGGEKGGEGEGGVFPSLPEVVVGGSVHGFGGEGLIESRRAQSCLVTLFHIAHGHAKGCMSPTSWALVLNVILWLNEEGLLPSSLTPPSPDFLDTSFLTAHQEQPQQQQQQAGWWGTLSSWWGGGGEDVEVGGGEEEGEGMGVGGGEGRSGGMGGGSLEDVKSLMR